MRRDELYLSDIVEAADPIASFLSGRGRDSFLQDDLPRSAVLHKLTIIGEAAARVSEDLRGRHPEVEWPDIVGFRNIAVHAYFTVDWSIVWTTAAQDAPQLRRQVLEILRNEFGQQ
ncbi:MAG TPA: DUF86 domain-containing protein [Pyrinomonadaceae bacterium]|jgi:uncharacterized protein with HEPN domain